MEYVFNMYEYINMEQVLSTKQVKSQYKQVTFQNERKVVSLIGPHIVVRRVDTALVVIQHASLFWLSPQFVLIV